MRKPFRFIIITPDAIKGTNDEEVARDCALDFDTCYVDTKTQQVVSVDGEQPIQDYQG